MTASAPAETRKLPGVVSLLTLTQQFLTAPGNASVLYGFAGWLLLPIIIRLLGMTFFPAAADIIDIITAISSFALSLWASACMMLVTTATLRPDLAPQDPGVSVSELAWRRAPTLLWVSLLATLLQAFGFVLLIIPGVLFVVWFAFAEVEVVLTGAKTFSALEQSKERSRGFFFPVLWRLFALSFLTSLVAFLILVPIFAMTGMTDPAVLLFSPPAWVDALLNGFEILLMPVLLTYTMLLYFHLRKP